jgi:hypothetical protein
MVSSLLSHFSSRLLGSIEGWPAGQPNAHG